MSQCSNRHITKQLEIVLICATVARVTNRKKFVDLSWSGATGTNVEIYRDNVRVVASTPNDGAYTDQPKGKGPSFTYRVCNVGGTVCSNNAAVTF